MRCSILSCKIHCEMSFIIEDESSISQYQQEDHKMKIEDDELSALSNSKSTRLKPGGPGGRPELKRRMSLFQVQPRMVKPKANEYEIIHCDRPNDDKSSLFSTLISGIVLVLTVTEGSLATYL